VGNTRESLGKRAEMTDLLNQMMEAALEDPFGPDPADHERQRLIGYPVEMCESKPGEKSWRFAAIDKGTGLKKIIGVLRTLGDVVEKAVIGVHSCDVCTLCWGSPLVRPVILKEALARHRGLVVGYDGWGEVINKGTGKKPWEVDWSDPRLNPIVAAINDGRLPENPTDEDLEKFGQSGSFQTSPKKRKRFLRSASKAYPFTVRRTLW